MVTGVVVEVGNENRVELDAGEKCSLVGVPEDITEKRGLIGAVKAMLCKLEVEVNIHFCKRKQRHWVVITRDCDCDNYLKRSANTVCVLSPTIFQKFESDLLIK